MNFLNVFLTSVYLIVKKFLTTNEPFDKKLINNRLIFGSIEYLFLQVVDKQYNIEVNDLVILNYQDKFAGTYTCDVEATGTFFEGRTSTAKSYIVKTAGT